MPPEAKTLVPKGGPRLAPAIDVPPPFWPTPGTDAPRINIGLDFGTSSTKVCVRPGLGLGPGTLTYPIQFEPTATNPYLCPSTVTCADGHLFFGAIAEQKSSRGQVWRRIKVCLACEAEGRMGSSACDCRGKGFSLAGFDSGPIELATLYLAWLLGEVNTRLPRALTGGSEPRLTCNLGVPVDQVDKKSPLHQTYLRIAQSAWLLKGHVGQGIEVSRALGWLTHLRNHTALTIHDDPVVLCPETSAAVVSQLSSATPMPEGMYALVDIGAWTTDISVFRLTDVAMVMEGVRTTAFYEAETHRVAAGRIDQLAANLVHSNAGALGGVAEFPSRVDELAEMFRRRREAGESAPQAGGDGNHDRALDGALDFMRAVVAGDVKKRYQATAEMARRKESHLSLSDWISLTVLLLGGGSEEACFEAALKKSSAAPVVGKVVRDERLEGVAAGPEGAAHGRRLQVAAGLAIPAALWPKRFLPSDVERVPGSREPRIRVRPDRDELYPK